eukprot:1122367-Lingulodinium_polyedra.AAC.1
MHAFEAGTQAKRKERNVDIANSLAMLRSMRPNSQGPPLPTPTSSARAARSCPAAQQCRTDGSSRARPSSHCHT